MQMGHLKDIGSFNHMTSNQHNPVLSMGVFDKNEEAELQEHYLIHKFKRHFNCTYMWMWYLLLGVKQQRFLLGTNLETNAKYLHTMAKLVYHQLHIFVEYQRWMSAQKDYDPDSKVHGANMGPTWVLSAPGGPHVGPMNFAIGGHSRTLHTRHPECYKFRYNILSSLLWICKSAWVPRHHSTKTS